MTGAQTTNQQDHARDFHDLHVPGRPLVLPNAWDVASARLIEQAGASAIATTSAGVAWSLGVPDGDALDRDAAAAVIGRIAAAVGVPVTADIESGYGENDATLAETISMVIEAGAVGVNIEDAHGAGLRPVGEQAHRVEVARAAADRAGVALYINARTDPFLHQVGQPEQRLPEALLRARAYLDAGASGIFVPGVLDLDVIRALTDGIDAPVNVLAGPRAPSVSELATAGVARISTGSSLAGAVLATLRDRAGQVLREGSFAVLDGGISHSEMNALIGDR